jgi:hypothetical protein
MSLFVFLWYLDNTSLRGGGPLVFQKMRENGS